MKLNLNPKVVFEIGVGSFYTCRSKINWHLNVKHCLFEPNPIFYREILQESIKYNNIYVYNCCIYDKDDVVDFYMDNLWSFVKGVYSPSQQQLFGLSEQIFIQKQIKINAFKISNFDLGNIDVLFLSCEGCEWFVLKHLISRPQMISVCNFNDSGYINPYLNEINNWLVINDYYLVTKSKIDRIFAHRRIIN